MDDADPYSDDEEETITKDVEPEEEEEDTLELEEQEAAAAAQVSIIVPDNERVFSDTLSVFEKTELISVRIAQISKTGHAYIDIGNMDTPELIATKELEQRKSPLLLIRNRGSKIVDGKKVTYCEIWNPNEMIH